MHRAFVFKAKLGRGAAERADRQLMLCRELYNACIEHRRTAWEKARVSVSRFQQDAELKEIRRIRPEFAELDAQVLGLIVHRVGLAFAAFFRRVKAGQKPGYPRFRGHSVRSCGAGGGPHFHIEVGGEFELIGGTFNSYSEAHEACCRLNEGEDVDAVLGRLAALRTPERQQGWRSMDSAPHDGTIVLVHWPMSDVIRRVRWDHGAWRDYKTGMQPMRAEHKPDLWLPIPPLPAPPTESESRPVSAPTAEETRK